MLYTSDFRPVHSKAISTSLGSIQPRCNCAKTVRSHFHHCLYCQVLIYTAERTVATWGDQTCQRLEATAVGFETGFSRLRVRPSNWYAFAPHIKHYTVIKADNQLFVSTHKTICVYDLPMKLTEIVQFPGHSSPSWSK